MRKKIMFFLYALSGGGAERTVINIINNIDKNKFEIVLVLGTNKNNDYIEFLSKDIKLKILNSKKLRYSILKLANCIRLERPDLIFSTINANNITLLLAKILTFRKIPTIVREAHNLSQSGFVLNINKWLTSILYNKVSDKIIALSNGVKDDLINNFGIKKDKINVIYNPIEIEVIKKMSNEKIKDFVKKDDEKLLIAVGRLVEQKDFATLIKAFNIVSKKVNSKLLILGKGPLENELKDLCKSFGLENKVKFLGFKKNPYKYMKMADVFILSSKYEGFGHVVVEAMACGTPVISTDCNSGPPEIIENNKYGILVPVGDYKLLANEIIKLLGDEMLQKRLSKIGIKRAQEFEAKSIVKKYEKIFLETINLVENKQ